MTTQADDPPILLLNSLGEQQIIYLQETLRHLIDHIARRIEYTESRRSVLAVTGGAIFAVSVSLLTLALTKVDYYALWLSLTVFSVIGIVVGALSWVLYARQTNFHYPFTEAERSWKWFYPDALPSLKPFSVPWHGIQSKESVQVGRAAFTSQWKSFSQKQSVSLSDRRTSTLEDLRQVYLLHVNERYKNIFLSHLRSIIQRGLLCAVLAATVSFPIGLVTHSNSGSIHSGIYRVGDLIVISTWRETGETRVIQLGDAEFQMLLNFSIRNEGKLSFAGRAIIAKDQLDMSIPVSMESMTPIPLVAPPASTVEAQSLVWIPRSLRRRVHHFELFP
jgi:hypothetical protein